VTTHCSCFLLTKIKQKVLVYIRVINLILYNWGESYKVRGRSAKGRKSQEAKELRRKKSQGQISQGAKRQRGEKAIIFWSIIVCLSVAYMPSKRTWNDDAV